MIGIARTLYHRYLRRYGWARTISAGCWNMYWAIYWPLRSRLVVLLYKTIGRTDWGARLIHWVRHLRCSQYPLVIPEQVEDTPFRIYDNVIARSYSRILLQDGKAMLPLLDLPAARDALKEYLLQEEMISIADLNLPKRRISVPYVKRVEKLPGYWVSCLGHSATNWMHWLTEIYPKVVDVAQTGRTDFSILVDAGLPEQMIETLALWVDPKRMLAIHNGRYVELEHLIVPKKDNNWSLFWPRNRRQLLSGRFAFDADRLKKVRAHIFEKLEIRHAEPKRQVMLMRKSSLRVLENSEEICAHLEGRGFDIIDTSDMDFAEQVACFSGASLVVGQAGAALANIMFMQPGTRVVCMAAHNAAINYDYFREYAAIFGVTLEYVIGDVRNPAAYNAVRLGSAKHPMNAGYHVAWQKLEPVLAANLPESHHQTPQHHASAN